MDIELHLLPIKQLLQKHINESLLRIAASPVYDYIRSLRGSKPKYTTSPLNAEALQRYQEPTPSGAHWKS